MKVLNNDNYYHFNYTNLHESSLGDQVLHKALNNNYNRVHIWFMEIDRKQLQCIDHFININADHLCILLYSCSLAIMTHTERMKNTY